MRCHSAEPAPLAALQTSTQRLFDFQFCSASAPRAGSVSLAHSQTHTCPKELSGQMRIPPSWKVAERGGTFPSLDCRICIKHLLPASILAGSGLSDPGGQTEAQQRGELGRARPPQRCCSSNNSHTSQSAVGGFGFLASIQQTARISGLVIPAPFPVCLLVPLWCECRNCCVCV